MPARHLVLVGGGRAHLTVLKKLRENSGVGRRVTLLDPSSRHVFDGVAAGLLSGIYDARDARFDLREMLPAGGQFIEDRVEQIDPRLGRLVLSSGVQLSYDLASFCIGSRILHERVSGDPERMVCVRPVENLLQARKRVLAGLASGPMHLVVAGGGPTGVETAAHLWRLQKESGGSGRICLAAGGRLLSGFAPRFRTLALESLQRRGIEVCEGVRLVHVEGERAVLSDETERRCDLAFLAVGTRPAGLFRDSGLPVGAGGGLVVDEQLRCPGYPQIFGGGSCIEGKNGSVPKGSVHAQRDGDVLADNLLAALDEEPLSTYQPPEDPLALLDLGDGTALLHKGSRVVSGRAAWRFKDWLDRRFMRRLQRFDNIGKADS